MILAISSKTLSDLDFERVFSFQLNTSCNTFKDFISFKEWL